MSTFEDLPDEVILKVFSNLNIRDIVSCGHVSKRFRAISHVKSLWQKINMSNLKVSSKFLEMILNNGCTDLNLQKTRLKGEWSLTKPAPKRKKWQTQLTNLDLSCCYSYKLSEGLLEACHSLQKLNLNKSILNENIVNRFVMQNHETLQMLDLEGCHGLSDELLEIIVKNCVELRELKIGLAHPFLMGDGDGIKILANNLTPNILKIDIYSLSDNFVDSLVKRCNKLTVLNLTVHTISTKSVESITQHLKFTLQELDIKVCSGWKRNEYGSKLPRIDRGTFPKIKWLNVCFHKSEKCRTCQSHG